ncbi:MAG: acetate/propionate family kinase [Nanobdellota archaeon]
MKVLVINSGSSSVKFQIIDNDEEKAIIKGHIDGIGLDNCKAKIEEDEEKVKMNNHSEALQYIFSKINTEIIDAVGHRVVHGGSTYSDSVLIDENVKKEIESKSSLAPLHNPPNLKGIEAVMKNLNVPQVAVFDTAFHQTIPSENYKYAINKEYTNRFGIRKYGFHGTSYKYINEKLKKKYGSQVNAIICHLGNGASICSIKEGVSYNTSMGLTPLPGLVMGTRSGDVDPEIISLLNKMDGGDPFDIILALNKESGLKGLTGLSDMRDVYSKSSEDEKCREAIDIYSERLIQYIGSYYAQMGKLDVLVFTAGVGQGAFYLREKVCSRLYHFNIKINKETNKKSWIGEDKIISSEDSGVDIYVMPTNEELMIAKETEKIIKK